jgi:hypothetical protein
MRSRLFLSLLGILALLAASAAQAGTLTNATWTQVTQGFPMTRTGSQLGITGTSAGSTSISASLDYPDFSTKFFIPKTPNGVLDLAISITQGGLQGLVATPGMATVTSPQIPVLTVNGVQSTVNGVGVSKAIGVQGTVNVRTANHNTKGVAQSTFMTGINTLVMVPVSVGVPGTFTGSFIVLGINHFITVNFFGWTPAVLKFGTINSVAATNKTDGGLTTKFVALPPVTANGTWNVTPGEGGTVTLVSPSKISIDCGLAQRRTAAFTSLKMYFVPEPGFLLLLGAGGLSLVLLGSRRR